MNQPIVRILIAAAILGGVGFFAIQAMLTEPAGPDSHVEAPEATDDNTPVKPDAPAPIVPTKVDSTPETTRTTARATATGNGDVVTVTDGQSSLAGRVVDEAGASVEGAELRLYRGTSSMPGLNFPGARRYTGHSIMSDEEGTFLFDDVPGDKNYIIVATHADYAEATYNQVALADGDSLFLPREIVLTEGAKVFGIVKAADSGAPLAGAVVSLWDTMAISFQAPGQKKPFAETVTDNTGAYEFRHVSFAGSRVTASSEGYATISKGNTVLFAKVDDREVNFELPTALELNGVVVDSRGLPIAGATIQAFQVGQPQENGASEGTAASASDGTFRVVGLSPGTYNLSAKARGFTDRQHGAAEAGSSDTRILMEPRGTVRAQATVRATGAPATQLTVRVMMQRGDADPYPTGRSESFKTSDGTFEIDNLDPGTYVLEAESKGLAPTRSASFVVDRAQVAGPVAIHLTAGATLNGIVTDIDGSPIAGAVITIRSNGYVSNPIVDLFRNMPNTPQIRERTDRTGPDGSFHMENLIPVTKQVEIVHPKFPRVALNDIELQDELVLDIGRVALSSGGTIRGRALNEVGQPFSDCQITCSGGGLSNASRRPDANGFFEFNNLSEGEYSLTLQPERTADQAEVGLIMGVLYAQQTTQKVNVVNGKVQEITMKMNPPQKR